MATGLIIANINITDPEQYKVYQKLSSVAMKASGAEIVTRGGRMEVLEGDWSPERIVILRFPTFEAARAFYDSPEYRAAREARKGAANMRMIVMEGT